jgi:hypothetical protein
VEQLGPGLLVLAQVVRIELTKTLQLKRLSYEIERMFLMNMMQSYSRVLEVKIFFFLYY